MKHSLFLSLSIASLIGFNASASVATPYPYIVTDKIMINAGQKSLTSLEVLGTKNNLVIATVNDLERESLSEVAHEETHRCGGYFAFQTLEEAKSFITESAENNTSNLILADYTINQEDTVNTLISSADEFSMRGTIEKLSSFNNRYYQSQTGVDSQNWLKSHWLEIGKNRSDISVELFAHNGFSQPSVIATIKGKTDDVIVIGGHADSISGWWGRERSRAPGADDNASGTATVTETFRVLVQNGYMPEKTIKFMAYAAEEVGLLGSKEIARTFKNKGVNVVGVLQLDMTNFHGSNTDITIITDNTNQEQNNFLGNLIDKYLPELSWGRDTCGYACSDHASWTSQGYPASIPFETKKNDMNHNIHTANDTLENSGGDASHALKFAKLALAFVAELDK